MNTTAIELNSVSKEYKTFSLIPWKRPIKTKALCDVSFSCPEGKISCLLGPNGAGKTTILKILANLIIQDKGKINIHHKYKKKIGIATPNDRSFYWRLTGRQNLDFFASLYGLSGKRKKERIEQVITDTVLKDDAGKPFRQFSSGMKQKLIIARALLGDPQVLLLDEPTAHIDPLTSNIIHDMIINNFIKKRGATIILCTHDLHEAEKLADQIILLHKGKILEKGKLEEIRRKLNPYHTISIRLTKHPAQGWDAKHSFINIRKKREELIINIKQESEIPGIIESIVKNKGRIISCEIKEESLLTIFTRLTGEKNTHMGTED